MKATIPDGVGDGELTAFVGGITQSDQVEGAGRSLPVLEDVNIVLEI